MLLYIMIGQEPMFQRGMGSDEGMGADNEGIVAENMWLLHCELSNSIAIQNVLLIERDLL